MNIPLGQIAFEAYSKSTQWKTYDGKGKGSKGKPPMGKAMKCPDCGKAMKGGKCSCGYTAK